MPTLNAGFRQFLLVFTGTWYTKMSGPATVLFTVGAVFFSEIWLKLLLGLLAVVCGVSSSYAVWRRERQGLLVERGRNAKPEISVAILDALFDQADLVQTSRLFDGRQISTRLVYIALVVEFRNVRPCNASIDRCSLVIETPVGVLRPVLLSELEPEPTPVKLRSPFGIQEMEPNLSVVHGLTVTRYVRFAFNLRIGVDDDFQKQGTFVVSAIDSFGIERVDKKHFSASDQSIVG